MNDMHKLGEQWVEIIDGKEHMVKAVHPLDLCQGCLYNGNGGGCWWEYGLEDCGSGSKFIIKDLGILNEDGCLPNGWGEYPHVEGVRDTKTWVVWYRCVTRIGMYCTTDSYKTKEEAIDEWNRRG